MRFKLEQSSHNLLPNYIIQYDNKYNCITDVLIGIAISTVLFIIISYIMFCRCTSYEDIPPIENIQPIGHECFLGHISLWIISLSVNNFYIFVFIYILIWRTLTKQSDSYYNIFLVSILNFKCYKVNDTLMLITKLDHTKDHIKLTTLYKLNEFVYIETKDNQ